MVRSHVKHSPLNNDALLREADGLELLRSHIQKQSVRYLRIPKLLAVSSATLTMERVETNTASETQMKHLGTGLAMMHGADHGVFGFSRDNYIGLSVQHNVWSEDWGAFFLERRLMAQVNMIEEPQIKREFRQVLASGSSRLMDFLNANCQRASLLHGDLWQGNVLFDRSQVWLIDPAVYYGDSEADLAMTEMFGGFGRAFYRSYCAHTPLSQQYERKRDIYNLYHYLNHYNLFGPQYLDACRRGLSAISDL